ncbi:hypothetical protein AN958_00528 [Leucoagaricus sp. SymC.cos]|nr:hypothetical protein AN958_00528 [Leucoagaricus sp. SymC.cos]
MPRARPNLPCLNIPHEDRVEEWLDRFGDTDSIDEHPEYMLNLGAESPTSNLSIDDAIPTPPPPVFCRRSSSNPKFPRRRDYVDRDCGICFEYAVQPSRTLCCGMIFCYEHITDWLHGPSSDGRCPSCSAPCSTDNILSFASPALLAKPPKPSGLSNSCEPSQLTTSPTSLMSPSSGLRSQSTSTSTTATSKQSQTSPATTTVSASTVDSSVDSSILGLSPAPEETAYGTSTEQFTSSHGYRWLAAVGLTHSTRSIHKSYSSSSLADYFSISPRAHPSLSASPPSFQSPYPFINPGSSTVEVISRLASLMGLTLLFYALLAS